MPRIAFSPPDFADLPPEGTERHPLMRPLNDLGGPGIWVDAPTAVTIHDASGLELRRIALARVPIAISWFLPVRDILGRSPVLTVVADGLPSRAITRRIHPPGSGSPDVEAPEPPELRVAPADIPANQISDGARITDVLKWASLPDRPSSLEVTVAFGDHQSDPVEIRISYED